MSSKHILFHAEAREKVLKGATALADAVRVTLGPKAKCVLIEKKWGRPIACNDGVTIAKEFGSPEAIANRCADIRRQAESSTSDYDKEKLNERLARLAGGVAVLRVGAPTEAEMKSRKEALEDSISATKAAIREGVVPGCGLTLLRAIDAVEKEEQGCEGDERTGLRMLRRALEVPTRQIADNSAVDGGVVVGQMRQGTGNYGFDAARGTYVDLVEAGIIDPTQVVRTALENAVSVAGILLMTEATLTEVREPHPEPPMAEGFGE